MWRGQVDYLAGRMDAGVGAAGAHGAHGHPKEAFQRPFEVALNRPVSDLLLPACKAATEVGDAKRQTM